MCNTKKKIEDFLIEFGLKKKEFSIRKNHGGGSIAYTVTIKKFIRLSPIIENLRTFEKMDKCQVSGEILTGANIFIDVIYHDKVVANQSFMDAVKEAKSLVSESIDIFNTGDKYCYLKKLIAERTGWSEFDLSYAHSFYFYS